MVIAEIEIEKKGTTEELLKFFEDEGELTNGAYHYRDWAVPENQLNFWNLPYLLHSLSKGFIKKIAADDRLMICQQQASIAPGDQKSKPQHVLYDDEALMSQISGLYKQAFGKDIMFDFRGGKPPSDSRRGTSKS